MTAGVAGAPRVDTRLVALLQSRPPLKAAGASGADKGCRTDETDLPAERDQAQANPRLSSTHGDEERAQDPECAPGEGPQETVGLVRRMFGGGPEA